MELSLDGCKRVIKKIIERNPRYGEITALNKRSFGNPSYGSWTLHPDVITASSVVYSIGVGEDASFDLDMIETFGLSIFALDPTPKSIDWVRNNITTDHFHFLPYGLSDIDGTLSFNPPRNPEHVSFTTTDRPETAHNAIQVQVRKLATIMKELKHDHIDVLKMDIEGSEYGVIEDIIRDRLSVDQILVEFHHRFPSVGIKKTNQAIALLRSSGYILFNVSESKEEFSFVHQRLIAK